MSAISLLLLPLRPSSLIISGLSSPPKFLKVLYLAALCLAVVLVLLLDSISAKDADKPRGGGDISRNYFYITSV